MFIGNLTLAVLMAVQPGQETAGIRVTISLFEVPSMIVSYTVAGWSTPDGAVVGRTVGGNTTRSFPNRPAVLQNWLPAGSDCGDIKTEIREFMANNCIKAQHITVNEIAGHELVFDERAEAGQEVYQVLEEGRPSPFSYRLNIEPAWQNEEEIGLSLKVWLRWQYPYGVQEISGNVPERLVFDKIVVTKFGQTTLVGFPSSDSRGRRSIFWLALSAEKSCR
jgi:bacterioferritin-associated ferredoxin